MTTMIPVLKIEDKHKSRQCGYNPTVFVNNGPYDESRICDGESVLDMDSVNACINGMFDSITLAVGTMISHNVIYICKKCGSVSYVNFNRAGLRFELADLSAILKEKEIVNAIPRDSDFDILLKTGEDEFAIATVWLTEEDINPWRLQIYTYRFSSIEASNELSMEEILERSKSYVYELPVVESIRTSFLEYWILKENIPSETRVFDEFEKALSYLKNKNINDIAYIQLKKK